MDSNRTIVSALQAAHAVGRIAVIELADANGKTKGFVMRQMHGSIGYPWHVWYV